MEAVSSLLVPYFLKSLKVTSQFFFAGSGAAKSESESTALLFSLFFNYEKDVYAVVTVLNPVHHALNVL